MLKIITHEWISTLNNYDVSFLSLVGLLQEILGGNRLIGWMSIVYYFDRTHFSFFFNFYFIFKLYIIVLVLPNIKMNPPQVYMCHFSFEGFRGSSVGQKSACSAGNLVFQSLGFNLWVWKIPWRKKWQHIPVFLPGKSYG